MDSGVPTVPTSSGEQWQAWREVGVGVLQYLSPDEAYLATIVVLKRSAEAIVATWPTREKVSEMSFSSERYTGDMYLLLAKTWCEDQCK